MTLDALAAFDKRITADPKLDATFDEALVALLDTYAGTKDGQLSDRRLRALLLLMLEDAREQWDEDSRAGRLSSAQRDATADAVQLVQSPVFAGGLGVAEQLSAHDDAMLKLARFARASLSETKQNNTLRPLAAALFDYAQLLPPAKESHATYRALAEGFVPGVNAVLAGKGAPDVAHGLMWQNLTLLRDTVALDDRQVVAQLLSRLVALPDGTGASAGFAPVHVLSAALDELNRAQPGAESVLAADDWKAVLTRIASVLSDEERGFERLYKLVQCRNGCAE
jgi:hypothetical protein